MPKHTALALGIAFLLAGVALIAFGQLAIGLVLVVVSAVLETMFVFALRDERRRGSAGSEKRSR